MTLDDLDMAIAWLRSYESAPDDDGQDRCERVALFLEAERRRHAAAGTPLAGDHPDRLADAAERVSLLKEALYGLLHLRAQEQAGVGIPTAADWDRAFAYAAEVYGEEPPR